MGSIGWMRRTQLTYIDRNVLLEQTVGCDSNSTRDMSAPPCFHCAPLDMTGALHTERASTLKVVDYIQQAIET